MYVVGLTGGIGSGKTTVANHFLDLGIEIVDADLLAREVVLPGSKALASIADHFGQEILDSQGELRRGDLRNRVFADDSEKRWLEDLLHPLIRELMVSRIEGSKSPYCLLVSPLLLETAQSQLVNRILVVDISEESQLKRTLARDGGDGNTIKAIIQSQCSREQRLAAADDVIDNELPAATLPGRVLELHRQYLELAKEFDAQRDKIS